MSFYSDKYKPIPQIAECLHHCVTTAITSDEELKSYRNTVDTSRGMEREIQKVQLFKAVHVRRALLIIFNFISVMNAINSGLGSIESFLSKLCRSDNKFIQRNEKHVFSYIVQSSKVASHVIYFDIEMELRSSNTQDHIFKCNISLIPVLKLQVEEQKLLRVKIIFERYYERKVLKMMKSSLDYFYGFLRVPLLPIGLSHMMELMENEDTLYEILFQTLRFNGETLEIQVRINAASKYCDIHFKIERASRGYNITVNLLPDYYISLFPSNEQVSPYQIVAKLCLEPIESLMSHLKK